MNRYALPMSIATVTNYFWQIYNNNQKKKVKGTGIRFLDSHTKRKKNTAIAIQWYFNKGEFYAKKTIDIDGGKMNSQT